MNRQCLELQIQAVRFSASDPEAQESLDQVLSAIADDELTEEQARKVAKEGEAQEGETQLYPKPRKIIRVSDISD